MKLLSIVSVPLLLLQGCSQPETTSINQPVGSGNTVTLAHFKTYHLVGQPVATGSYLPSAKLITSDLKPFDTSQNDHRVKLFMIVPSLDTHVCKQQTIALAHYMRAHAAAISEIDFYVVSADTPKIQNEFIADNQLEDARITYLSDEKKHQFGQKTGTLIKELDVLTRAIMVTDQDQKIIHLQRVPELTKIPDLEMAVAVAKQALNKTP